MATRRSVLRVLGLAPVAAPIAAKAAADQAIADLAKVSTMGGELFGSTVAQGGPSPAGTDDWKKKVARFLAEKAVPSWIEGALRERCQHVHYLDPDIASKRSWSMNVKIAAQRERNIKRAMSEVFEGPKRSIRVQEFADKFGIWL